MPSCMSTVPEDKGWEEEEDSKDDNSDEDDDGYLEEI